MQFVLSTFSELKKMYMGTSMQTETKNLTFGNFIYLFVCYLQSKYYWFVLCFRPFSIDETRNLYFKEYDQIPEGFVLLFLC